MPYTLHLIVNAHLDPETPIEIADFGLGRWEHAGLGIVIRVNEPEYCSKHLTLFPGQLNTLKPGVNRKFRSVGRAIIEED